MTRLSDEVSTLQAEINFLRKFRERFSTRADYKAALKDLYNEGIITQTAYYRVIDTLPKPLKKKPRPATIISGCDRPIDPCGTRAMRYDSCSSNRSSC